jgi:hypothetical protein
MTMTNRDARGAAQRHWLGALLLTLLPVAGYGQPASSTAPDAKAILMRMAEHMAGLQRFSFDVRASYDTLQPSQQKLEFNETRRYVIARPDRLRVDVEESDGTQQTLVFDGQHITVVTPSRNVYAQVAKPGTIDDAIVFFVRDLHMRLPLAMLLLNTAPQEFARRTQSVELIERTQILGTPAFHLAGRTTSVDYQIWISDSDKPLPLRLVLTYRHSAGQPQFRAQFLNLNTNPQLTETTFVVNPAAGAQRIPFVAQVPRTAGKPKSTSESKKAGVKK